MEASSSFSARRRNYMLSSHRRDNFISFIKEMLHHSFVLNHPESYRETMCHIEDLMKEHMLTPETSKLKQVVPTMGNLFTSLPLSEAFDIYNNKYCITSRRFVTPSFNEIRHILNLAQIMAIKDKLKLITFDGDQTLYSDGGNFEQNGELTTGILNLLENNIIVAVVTAAGYGGALVNAPKYEIRLEGLLRAIETSGMSPKTASNLLLMGGECNYLFRCELKNDNDINTGINRRKASLIPVPSEEWQAEHLNGPKPVFWNENDVKNLLDCAEETMKIAIKDMRLRAKLIRKPRSCGLIPGGLSMIDEVPIGHGSLKLKREALDEIVLRMMEALRNNPNQKLPYCCFNGGRDAWVDVGDKAVGVAALKAWFNFDSASCIHVGDQFLNVGNDIKAREQCPCLWITTPKETAKMLIHVGNYCNVPSVYTLDDVNDNNNNNNNNNNNSSSNGPKMDVFTGEILK